MNFFSCASYLQSVRELDDSECEFFVPFLDLNNWNGKLKLVFFLCAFTFEFLPFLQRTKRRKPMGVFLSFRLHRVTSTRLILGSSRMEERSCMQNYVQRWGSKTRTENTEHSTSDQRCTINRRVSSFCFLFHFPIPPGDYSSITLITKLHSLFLIKAGWYDV